MEYAIVFIRYQSYSAFYECNNRNITYDIFSTYAKIKEDMVKDEYKPCTRLPKLPSHFPDMFNKTYYHPSIVKNVLLLLNARSNKKYTPYFIDLKYKHELWCFETDGFYKPLFFHNVDEKNIYDTKIKEFLKVGFPITDRDVYKHPFKEFKFIKLPNSFYFTKGIYIKKRFFDYIVDLLETPSNIFKDRECVYEDDLHTTMDESNFVEYDVSSNITDDMIDEMSGEQESKEESDETNQLEESKEEIKESKSASKVSEIQKNYIDSKINRPIQIQSQTDNVVL